MSTKSGSLVIALMTALTVVSADSVPPLLNYQAVLRGVDGNIVPDGNYSVTYRIWDTEVGGAALWQEGRLVTVQDGLFTVLLGSIVPIPDTLFSRPDRWIGLQVGLDPEMTPRQRLVSVPFAWHAGEADMADSAAVAKAVDTSGYSAYQDLLSETRIGTGASQLASGDHLHAPPSEASSMMRYEDTTVVTLFSDGDGGGRPSSRFQFPLMRLDITCEFWQMGLRT